MIGFGIIIPVLPFFAEELGATPTQLGLLMAVYSLMQLLFAPMWGRISDRIGRKPVLLIGISGLALSFFLFALSTEYWMLLASRIIGGFLSAANMPTAMAYVADITSEEDRGKGMGIVGAAVGLGFVFGPAVGGVFSKISLNMPFWVAGILSTITFLFVLIALNESLPKEKRSNEASVQKIPWETIKSPIGLLYFLSFFITFSMAGLEATFAYFAAKRAGIDTVQLGYIFMIMGLAGAAVQGGLVGRLIKKHGEGKVIQAGIIVSIVGFCLLLFTRDFWTATIFLTIFGLGNGVIRPSASSLITKTNSEGYGGLTGLLSSFESLGRIIGPPLAGAVYSVMIELPYIIGAVLSFVALILYQYYAKKMSIGMKVLKEKIQ